MNDVGGVMRDPQVRARGMLVAMPLPNGRQLTVAGCPVRFAGEQPLPATPAPGLDDKRSWVNSGSD